MVPRWNHLFFYYRIILSSPSSSNTRFLSFLTLLCTKNIAYGAYARLEQGGLYYNNPQPTFKCQEKNDAFTVGDEEKGNGALTYPVGLMTADEVVAAVAPVINLSAEYVNTMIGDGTIGNEYRVE